MTTPARRLPLPTDKRLWATLALLAVPLIAEANAGTPLMWMAMVHLMFGNALIGLLEGLLIAFVFQASKGRAILLMIVANYLSAWLGLVFFLPHLGELAHPTLASAKLWMAIFFLLAYLFTLVVELPFVLFALGKGKRTFKRVFMASLLVNSVSYALLILIYALPSGTSLVTGLELVSANQMDAPKGYLVYYLSDDDRSVCRIDLTGTKGEPVTTLESMEEPDSMTGVEREDGSLDIVLNERRNTDNAGQVVLRGIEEASGPEGKSSSTRVAFHPWFGSGEVDDWEYDSGFWPIEGVSGRNDKTGEGFHYAFETPFFQWSIRSVTVIDDGFLVFGLEGAGGNEICLLDPASKKIAVLAPGRFPVVARTVSGVEQVDDSGH